MLLRYTANNSRITVGKHDWDLKQEGRTDGGKHYTHATHTITHMRAHTHMHTPSHTDPLLTLSVLKNVQQTLADSIYLLVSVCPGVWLVCVYCLHTAVIVQVTKAPSTR